MKCQGFQIMGAYMPASYREQGPLAPAQAAVAVTPHDTNELSRKPTRAIFVGVGGDVAVKLTDDTSAVTFKNVPGGTILPIGCYLVLSTGTTATNILALY